MASPSIAFFFSYFLVLAAAKSLWSSVPANASDVIRTAYPLGNGQLAVLPFGEPGNEKLNLNCDTLWAGGPFENTSYSGGNPPTSVSQYLPGIRDWIWQNGTGNVSALMVDSLDYGSYTVLGNLSVRIADVEDVNGYKRALDLDNGVHTTMFESAGAQYTIKVYCSYPDHVCVYDIASNMSMPEITVSMENVLSNASLVSSSCQPGQLSLNGTTQAEIGMKYLSVTRIVGEKAGTYCEGDTLVIPSSDQREVTIVLAAGTNYDETRGTASENFSFRGADPGPSVEKVVGSASQKSNNNLLAAHISDYNALSSVFTLDLPDTAHSAGIETADLIARYNANSTGGDPYLESLVFDYGRYLFISSTRDGSLPPNLQGKWSTELASEWGSDYHADINLEMNYWLADQTGLGALQASLWKYMTETWAPRGAETAKLLYDAPGWVTHDEMNIFGYTGMKLTEPYWANYPASAAWMMQHVWDYYDYSRDIAWLNSTGYPLLKPIAEFWVSQLQQDQYFQDGTLVVNPCDSPEHGPTTFGCMHWQQLIYQVFETTIQSAGLVGDTDAGFMSSVRTSLAQLDKGLHIGSWGQVQEWKLDIDVKNDTHRHLSNLVGWFPGWSISSYLSGYTNTTVQNAVTTTLWSRGPGIADSNAGWEKVWRAACWARLNNTEEAYYELRLTIFENWAPNALSLYSGKSEPFQIDANFGFGGAVLSMLVVDLPQLSAAEGVRTVVLGPAIPDAWAGGSVKGLRIRGGGSVDFSWNNEGLVDNVTVSGGSDVRIVDKNGRLLAKYNGG